MTDRVYALYKAMETAVTAVNTLIQDGTSPDQISLITRDADNKYAKYVDFDADFDNVDAEEGSAFGSIVGALTGLGVALIPGFGPLFATGPFAAALLAAIGAGSGAITGGITATLLDFGADTHDIEYYEHILREGGALVIVDTLTEQEQQKVEHTLADYHPLQSSD